MIKNLKTFFYPVALTYSYNKPKDFVITRIAEVFEEKVTLFGSNDIIGKFLNQTTFTINTYSPINTHGAKYSSTLVGQIFESGDGITEIRTKSKPSLALYAMFFITPILGLGSLYKFIQIGSFEFLLWFLAIFFLGPVLAIKISNVAIYSIRERYNMSIDKALKA